MPSSMVDPVSWDIAADLPMGRFLTLTFLLTFLGTNVISWNIALLVSTGVTVVTAGLAIALEFLRWEPQEAGYALHVASFQLFLCIFLVSACIQKPMRYLTTWCVLLHIIYFGTFDISNPKLDSFVSWSHPASFVAACFVYIGFFVVSNFYGGGAPKDMIPAIAECPVLHSFCIGWNHISPVLCHLIDGYLNGSNFHRIYGQGGVLWLLVVGVGIFYTVGQVYEWLMPNSVETYLAPEVWYLRSRRLAQQPSVGRVQKEGNHLLFRRGLRLLFGCESSGHIGGRASGQMFRCSRFGAHEHLRSRYLERFYGILCSSSFSVAAAKPEPARWWEKQETTKWGRSSCPLRGGSFKI
ncbi:Napsa [Symbiodinium sp. CCMP2456]|nr:Napsa [Symbiodinium sp. CCMP2456]